VWCTFIDALHLERKDDGEEKLVRGSGVDPHCL
jgi:hypothetical protein